MSSLEYEKVTSKAFHLEYSKFFEKKDTAVFMFKNKLGIVDNGEFGLFTLFKERMDCQLYLVLNDQERSNDYMKTLMSEKSF